MTKLKLRIVDGIPEVDGDPNEIAEVLRQLSIAPPSKQPTPQREEREISNIQNIEEINPRELVKIIESNGEPFTFSMGDLQKRLLGRRISSKDEKERYELFRRAFDNAKKLLEEKYPDHEWGSIMTKVDGSLTKRFTMVRKPSMMPVQQQIQAQVEQPKNQPREEEVDLLKL